MEKKYVYEVSTIIVDADASEGKKELIGNGCYAFYSTIEGLKDYLWNVILQELDLEEVRQGYMFNKKYDEEYITSTDDKSIALLHLEDIISELVIDGDASFASPVEDVNIVIHRAEFDDSVQKILKEDPDMLDAEWNGYFCLSYAHYLKYGDAYGEW